MPFKKGTTAWKDRVNPGRKTISEESLKVAIRMNAEQIAESKITKHLEAMSETDRQGLKDIALPVYLKSKTDKSEVEITLPKPLLESLNVSNNHSNKENSQTNQED